MKTYEDFDREQELDRQRACIEANIWMRKIFNIGLNTSVIDVKTWKTR